LQQKAPGGVAEKITLRYRSRSDRVTLQWTIASEKKVERVVVYKAIGWQDLTLLGHSTESSYEDFQVALGKTYRYRIQIIYDDGTSSALSDETTIKL